ncbi:hypothetical protein [Nannocystis pusilla]|uniref:hypothetical protein n=1 Tax=Nannocystis pusilla TaxID=889268 RepID=UPI003B7F72CD
MAGVAVAALVLRYGLVLAVARGNVGPAWATARYVGDFTVLSNGLVALTAGLAAAASQRPLARLLARPGARGGVGLYIVVTFGLYFLVLRHLWRRAACSGGPTPACTTRCRCSTWSGGHVRSTMVI